MQHTILHVSVCPQKQASAYLKDVCSCRSLSSWHTWSMRHLTSDGLKGLGMASTSLPRSCVQYSNTRKMLHSTTPIKWQRACLRVRLIAATCAADSQQMCSPLVLPLQTLLCFSVANQDCPAQPGRSASGGLLRAVRAERHLSGLLPVTTFLRCTMFGWRHCCSTLISRMDVTGMPAVRHAAPMICCLLFRVLA